MKQRSFAWLSLALTLSLLVTATVLYIGDGMPLRPPVVFAEGSTPVDSPFKAVYRAVSPAVVGIEVTLPLDILAGRIRPVTGIAGSGVVISADGYVLTNYHVVDGATSVAIISEEKTYAATYIAGDAANDVAVLHVDNAMLPWAVLGDSDALVIGDWALVIGNPLGEQFMSTLTVGVISGLDRVLDSVGGIGGANAMIQTDAAINAGNSGGGLFNLAGELVGITSMKLASNGFFGTSIEGIGFAIPINAIQPILQDLIRYGRVLYPRIGITMASVNGASLELIAGELPRSVWVMAVEPNSPAERAGIQVDDLILSIDGVRVGTSEAVHLIIRNHAVGDTLAIEVLRIPNLSQIKAQEAIPAGETLFFDVSTELLDAS